ncbi:MAG: Group 1 glycosyl transferase [Candidatus Kaiserbacteria bacterium GW2011_GWA2_49_19]|uniref:Group 1 glycosyl transferase n=1 Tax=Candidatus Kaiserbacteria bacterium GW2011_GWA2_49_19 TaxID=1618669 RepID=A0A0G1YRY0_9BACT|nr:MAG: Group 1 glycosyl transferase [Candidatus Kaiserbacteria bacterium GW2011_GWA2_49_19]
MTKPKIIFTTPVLGYPPIGGPRLRIDNSLKALARVADLIVYSRVSKASLGGDAALEHFAHYARQFVFAPSVDPNKKEHNKRLIRFVDFFDLVKLAKRENVSIIWMGYGNISYGLALLLLLCTKLKIVIDTDSVWSRFVFRSLPHMRSKKLKFKKLRAGAKKLIQEFLGTRLADMTTAVSECDARYYRKFSKRVSIFSNVIDLQAYREIPAPRVTNPAVYLAGSFGPDSPMEESALWVINEVLPLVWTEIPELKFYIVGRGPTEKMLKLQNDKIIITGEVPSVMPYLCHVDAVLVPLQYESGTRFKILETAAVRVPIISTTLGAEGIDYAPGQDLLIADTAQAFAHMIRNIIKNKSFAKKLADHAYQHIALNYHIDRAEKEAKIILERVV